MKVTIKGNSQTPELGDTPRFSIIEVVVISVHRVASVAPANKAGLYPIASPPPAVRSRRGARETP
jgi:hypothetical protein